MTMQLNLNNKKRGLYDGSSKSWCRVPVMARSVRTPFLSSYSKLVQSSFYTNSTGASKTQKIFKRSFRNKKLCREFIKNLSKRYFRRFKKHINFRINLKQTKIEYYQGEKI
jgi:hypothetical protein|tara:strand:- start:334 stop:666 length:333 start_codon:yes stop_codon:yes gene_type:complete